MPELEIHHEHGHEEDSTSKKVGLQAALLAVALAVVTIASHRAHTDGVMKKAEANDRWGQYQATRLKHHTLELGDDLLSVLGGKSEAAEKVIAKYKTQKEEYAKKGEDIKKKAEDYEEECLHAEQRAFFYDVGEGLLEIGLVLSSLYFISKKKFFPVLGLTAGLGGSALAIWGLLH